MHLLVFIDPVNKKSPKVIDYRFTSFFPSISKNADKESRIIPLMMTRSLSKEILGVSNMVCMGKPITHRFILEKFGDKLQKVRKGKRISQEELAETLSMHRTYIGLIERGQRNPTVRTLYKIVKALGIKSADILPF